MRPLKLGLCTVCFFPTPFSRKPECQRKCIKK
uniref:Uncharacterized protein n=1 Tax=Anguilla anguilla TaxID=7936 RepID=A0A0E9RET7_ANGAN